MNKVTTIIKNSRRTQ